MWIFPKLMLILMLISGVSYYLSNSKSKRDDCKCIMACEIICGVRFINIFEFKYLFVFDLPFIAYMNLFLFWYCLVIFLFLLD